MSVLPIELKSPFMRTWCAPEAPATIEIRRCTTLSAKWTEIPLDQIDFADPSFDSRRGKIKIDGEWYYLRRPRSAVLASVSSQSPTHASRAKAKAEVYELCVASKHELEVLPGASEVRSAIRAKLGCTSDRMAAEIYEELVEKGHLSAELSRRGRRRKT